MSKGGDIDASILQSLDALEGKIGGVGKTTGAVLTRSVEDGLAELKNVFAKLAETKGADGRYEAQRLDSKIQSNLRTLWKDGLIPPEQLKKLSDNYSDALNDAWKLGNKEGVDLTDLVRDKNKSAATKGNSKVNLLAVENAGRRLAAFWNFENADFKNRVTALTQLAIAKGWSYRKLALEIRGLLRTDPNQSREGQRRNRRMGILGRAELIARTEMQAAYIDGKIRHFRERGVGWVRWSAAFERTCPFCASRHGLVFDLNDVESDIPAHPRCRCTLIPTEKPDGWDDKNADKGALAAQGMDDAYWANARASVLNAWKKAQGTTKRDLNSELRRYLNTPTNTRKKLLNTDEAPKPVWMPGGRFLPDSGRIAEAIDRAQAEERSRAERARLEKEKAEAEKQRKQEEEQKAREKAEREAQRAPQAIRDAGLEKGWQQMDGAMRAKLEAKVNQANQAAAAAAAGPRLTAANHYVKGNKKAYVTPEMLQEAFDALTAMPGLSGEHARQLTAFMQKHQMAVAFVPKTPQKVTMKNRDMIQEEIKAVASNPNMRAATDNARRWHRNDSKDVQKNIDALEKLRNIAAETGNTFASGPFRLSGGEMGFTNNGYGHVVQADWKGHKKIGKLELETIRQVMKDEMKQIFDGKQPYNTFEGPLYTAIDKIRAGAKRGDLIGPNGQTEYSWLTVMIHELGHQVHMRGGARNYAGKHLDESKPDYKQHQNDPTRFSPSKYGDSNIWEQFAETFVHYVFNPEALKQADPKAFEWISNHMKRSLEGTEVPSPNAEGL